MSDTLRALILTERQRVRWVVCGAGRGRARGVGLRRSPWAGQPSSRVQFRHTGVETSGDPDWNILLASTLQLLSTRHRDRTTVQLPSNNTSLVAECNLSFSRTMAWYQPVLDKYLITLETNTWSPVQNTERDSQDWRRETHETDSS